MAVPEPRWPGTPQLRMERPNLDDLPPLVVPAPYWLRTYRAGDESAWVSLMAQGIGPSWTRERWQRDLAAAAQFDPASLFFASNGAETVGSACGWRLTPAERETGYVHMVAVSSAHRGRKLGYWLTLRVLYRFRELGMRSAILDTDDHRLPAIELYYRLGFNPLPRHVTHQERWREIVVLLGR